MEHVDFDCTYAKKAIKAGLEMDLYIDYLSSGDCSGCCRTDADCNKCDFVDVCGEFLDRDEGVD